MLNWLKQSIIYGLSVLLFMVSISLLIQCGESEEIIPAGECTPEKCEFKVTQVMKVEK